MYSGFLICFFSCCLYRALSMFLSFLSHLHSSKICDHIIKRIFGWLHEIVYHSFFVFLLVVGSRGLWAPGWREQAGAAVPYPWFPMRRWSLSCTLFERLTTFLIHAEQRWKNKVCLWQSRVEELQCSWSEVNHTTAVCTAMNMFQIHSSREMNASFFHLFSYTWG